MLDKVWSSGSIRKITKVSVYETLVLSVPLYNSGTWTLTTAQENRSMIFETVCLQKIYGVTRKDIITTEDIRSRLQMRQDIISRIQPIRLHYFGHVCRMDSRYPKIAMHGYVHGHRGKGRRRKRWMDNWTCFKKTVKPWT